MNPTLKKMVAGIAVKEGVEQALKARRRRKRSLLARVTPKALVLLAGGAVVYLAKTGKLHPLMQQAKSTMSKEPGSQPSSDLPREPAAIS